MSNLENIKIGLISVLHTIVKEYDMTKEEIKDMIDNIQVEVIKEPKILN